MSKPPEEPTSHIERHASGAEDLRTVEAPASRAGHQAPAEEGVPIRYTPTSHVEQQVQARIAAAKVRIQAAKETREVFASARRRGVARRHARKLYNRGETERRRQAQQDDEGPELPPAC